MRRRDDVLASLRELIVNGIHFGRIAPGDRLPSARQLSRQLDADARVVRDAYLRLEQEGMVARRPGSRGYFAALGRVESGHAMPAPEWIVSVISDAIDRGISVKQFLDHARSSLESVHTRTTCMECNEDQLSWLCGELEDDYGFITQSVNTRLPAGDIENDPEVHRSDIIVTTSSHALLAQALGNKLRKPVVVVTLKPEIIAEVTQLLERGAVYFLCTDPLFETKLLELYSGVGNRHNIRTVRVGRDDPSAIPAGAPVWAMRRARAQLGEIPAHVRPLNTARIFSTDTREALLAHLVRANLAGSAAMRTSYS
ncbi:MAG: GntR family transcriptional regulator [Gemmatimonadota bacterium]|nr:GntR family transcriptional regulator [Gemmatimonadota bacterium]